MAAADRPRVLSGIQPTADSFHLGNYLGAIRQWVGLQDTHEAFYCVVDLHALTAEYPPPEVLSRRSRLAAAQLLAAGLEPERCALFVQSHVPQHAELAWILGCLTGFGEAARMTQFKDKSGKQANPSVGLFTYPILQAADILIYQAAQVPVGEDQRQHLELTRHLAQRFNARFGPTFVVPEPYIVKETAKILDLQDPSAKMSKSNPSQAGVVDLLEDRDSLIRKIRRAVTDTGTDVRADAQAKPGITNLLTIYSVLTGTAVADLERQYDGRGYGALKSELADAVVSLAIPFQERTRGIMDDRAALDAILSRGAQRACAAAEETLEIVRDRIGFVPAKR
ncbi:MAG TPA: tryptophan--tRNA ligase [Mycobacteriales bacterium]|nr:tryptophan--tRNA ligase [Mycobacteriales bacterium]